MRKIYCYVDESGQDTKGRIFVVSVVITEQERDRFIHACEKIEQATGKKNAKWIKTAYPRRLAYIQRILDTPLFAGRLTFAVYHNAGDYLALTVETIARALHRTQTGDYKVTVLIDALPRKHRTVVSRGLHAFGIRTRKVRGVRKDEYDPLIRLADAVCGLVRASHEGQPEMKRLLKQGVEKGMIEDLTR